MQQPKLGFATFRKLATDDKPYPSHQACIVVGLNIDGTANVVAYDADGQSFLYEKTKLTKCEDGVSFHYQPQPGPSHAS